MAHQRLGAVLSRAVLAALTVTVVSACGAQHPASTITRTVTSAAIGSTTSAGAPANSTATATTAPQTTTTQTPTTPSGPRTELISGPHVSGAGGKFGGYVYAGAITALAADWRVPEVAADSQIGKASTWIGAQAPGNAAAPFIQIGTQEEMRAGTESGAAPFRYYEAFFSDNRLHYHPSPLFTVHAGDRMRATMRLLASSWELTITDLTTGAHHSLNAEDETSSAGFNYALWLQEDVTDTDDNNPYPYPDVAAPTLSALSVNGAAPAADQLQSTWMSLPGGYLGPTPLTGEAFSVIPQRLSTAGAAYLTAAIPHDAATSAFAQEVEEWAPSTATATVEGETDAFVDTLTANLRLLRGVQWPATVTPLVGRIESADTYAIQHLQAAAHGGADTVFEVFRGVQARFDADTATALEIRARLDVPQLAY